MQGWRETGKAAALGLILVSFGASATAAFSLSGRYEGAVACDSTTEGRAWSWGREIALSIVDEGGQLRVEYVYTDKAELGVEFTRYAGQAVTSPDGAVVSGYFRVCDATFPAYELVRLFPTSTANEPFSFAADSIWVSDQVPNLPGLTVQSCKWAMKRVSSETPTVRACPTQTR